MNKNKHVDKRRVFFLPVADTCNTAAAHRRVHIQEDAAHMGNGAVCLRVWPWSQDIAPAVVVRIEGTEMPPFVAAIVDIVVFVGEEGKWHFVSQARAVRGAWRWYVAVASAAHQQGRAWVWAS